MKRENCPLCGSDKKAAVYPHKLEPISGIPTLYDSIAVCKVCGMVYAEAVMEQEIYDRYYREYSKYEANYQETYSPEIPQYCHNLANLIIESIPSKEAAIADFGAGYGSVLKLLKQRGYKNLAAVELSEANCRHIANDLGITAVNKSVFELVSEDSKDIEELDGIILGAVLEHIVELNRFIQVCSKRLKSGGAIIICVPFFEVASNVKTKPFDEFSPEHINYFTKHSLSLLMSLNGFTLQNHHIEGSSFSALYSVFVKSISETAAQYISQSRSNLEQSIKVISEYADSKNPIAIRGTGLLTRYLFANSRLSECNIAAISDTNKNYQGRMLGGHTISVPESFTALPSDVDILVISYLYTEAILCELNNLGVSNKIICLPIKKTD